MAVKIIAYSMNGNNRMYATHLGEELNCDVVLLEEKKTRSFGTIFKDIIFNTTPKLTNLPEFEAFDHIILIGPIWAGRPCTPLRKAFKEIKKLQLEYSFVSLSGGNLDHNVKAQSYLLKVTGKQPEFIAINALSELADQEFNPQDAMRYVASEDKIAALATSTAERLRQVI